MRIILALTLVFGYSHAMGVPGGFSEVNVTDPTIVKMAQFASTSWAGLQNTAFVSQKITHAEQQVVAGMNYKIKMELNDGSGKQECVFQVFSQVWTNTLQLTSHHCRPISMTRTGAVGMVGAPVEGTVNENVQMLASMATKTINAQMNSMYTFSKVSVDHVTEQLVAGMKYTFHLNLQQSTCIKSADNMLGDTSQCPLSSNGMTQSFEVTGLFVAWQTPQYRILDFKPVSSSVPEKPKVKLMKVKPKTSVVQMAMPTPKQSKKKHVKHVKAGKEKSMYDQFKVFRRTFKKVYGDRAEEKRRYLIFAENMKKAAKIQETEQKGSTARYGATQFADMTEEEFARYRGKPWHHYGYVAMDRASIPSGTTPTEFDWRDHNAVTPVKNQGTCGSCWAFSTTGNIEGQWAIKKKKLVSLSEQELVDCDKMDDGCEGGLPSNAYKEIIRLGGLETEKQYSYKGFDEKCFFNRSDAKVTINSSVNISSNEADMAAWLAKNGPISIGINAFAMQFYMGGIAHPWSIFCNPKKLDHGVLIVGYGVKDKTPYWIIKNSWGPSWGEKGYYLVYRGSGVCGLNTMCTSAVVD